MTPVDPDSLTLPLALLAMTLDHATAALRRQLDQHPWDELNRLCRVLNNQLYDVRETIREIDRIAQPYDDIIF